MVIPLTLEPMHAQPAGPDPLRGTVARMALGDESALEALYLAAHRRCLGIALRVLGERSAAEEVVVEVFAQAWRQARQYDPLKGSVSAWLATLARTRAIDQRRRQQRRTRLEAALPEQADYASAAAGPMDLSIDSEEALRVRRALSELPLEQRRCLEVAFFGGLSHSEVAVALGQPLGTVKTRIRTGLAALRRALAPAEEETA